MRRTEALGDRGPLDGWRLLVCWAALTGGVLLALALWQGEAYWEYSDGVYSLSARQLLHGQSLYRDFAAAQPPPLYYLAAGALALRDAPASIRVLMALCEAATSLLVLVAVRRLTGSPGTALCAAAVSLVTPWALREHAQLLPETVAAPLVMGAAVAAGRRTSSALAGVLGALAMAFKLAFVVPALAVVVAARGVRRAGAGFLSAGAILVLAFVGLFGEPLWTQVVRAQAQAGRASVDHVVGLWTQGGWNLLPLLSLAALAWPRRRMIGDRDLARGLLAAAIGSLALLATLVKHGSYLTVAVVAEPPLLCLAATAIVTLLRERVAADTLVRCVRAAELVAMIAVAVGVAQVMSLLLAPANPTLFTRPLAHSGPARPLSDGGVRTAAAAIRRCPVATAYGGAPYLAFVAGRGIAGSQPDQFIIEAAPVLARFRAAVRATPAICPRARG
jgi:hypothetical protein